MYARKGETVHFLSLLFCACKAQRYKSHKGFAICTCGARYVLRTRYALRGVRDLYHIVIIYDYIVFAKGKYIVSAVRLIYR